jgi:hypothetical protein
MCARGGGPIMDGMIAMLTLAAAGMLIPVVLLWTSDQRTSS